MKYNSKKHEGFTLIEIIISIAIIGIISIGVYNSYILIIKQTKAGQVKQTSALVGKQISEEIKSAAENEITPTAGSIYEMTNLVKFTKDGDIYKSTPVYFNEEGNVVSENYRYSSEIKLTPKLSKDASDPLRPPRPIVIEEFSKYKKDQVENEDVYIIKQGSIASAVSKKPDSINTDSLNITDEKDISIVVREKEKEDSIVITITLDSNDLDVDFEDEKYPILNMDMKYCIGEVTINVTNETQIPFNLCILNNNNVTVKNKQGVLNEYYRSEYGNKIGVLYDVNIEIVDEKSEEKETLFKTNFVQNINIK